MKMNNNEKIIHIMIGGIGTGKTTLANKLSQEMSIEILRADDSDYEDESKLFEDYLNLLDNEKSFILDGKYLDKKTRQHFIKYAKNCGYDCIGYDFGPGNGISLKRRLNNPGNYSSKEWIKDYRKDRTSYQQPQLNEGFKKIIRNESNYFK